MFLADDGLLNSFGSATEWAVALDSCSELVNGEVTATD